VDSRRNEWSILVAAHIILVAQQYPDPRRMGPYYEHVEETMARFGGGYQSVLRHRVTPLEGEWRPRAVTILEFPSYEQALDWYNSPEYAPLRALRTRLGRFDVILVDGIGDGDSVDSGQLDPWEVERIAELEAEERRAASGAARAGS
jgi:uncharacterized protein (DUF1330 family)